MECLASLLVVSMPQITNILLATIFYSFKEGLLPYNSVFFSQLNHSLSLLLHSPPHSFTHTHTHTQFSHISTMHSSIWGLMNLPTSPPQRRSVLGVHWKEAEIPILWSPYEKSWLVWKDPDAGKGWGQEEKGMTEDETVGSHHWLTGPGFG